jgi:hypothetical protein
MLSSLRVGHSSEQQNALSIIHGFNNFLERKTGDVDDNGDNVVGAFVINNEGMLCNNLHFEGGPQDYTPTQCSTTEGQSLLILGYYYLWKGTGNPVWLQKAEQYFDCYVRYFYGTAPVPNPPAIYRANWIMNGKNPFMVYGPPNPLSAQSPGFYGEPIQFTNGVGVIPAGGTTFGDKLVKVYQIFTGKFAYDSVRAGPAHGGTSYTFQSFMATNGAWDKKYNSTTMSANTAVGTIILDDTSFTGTLSVSYVIESANIIGRNQPFDVWPTWRTLQPDELGNAIDAEQWFTEAALLLYKATGNPLYNQIYQCGLLTCLDATVVDDVTYYFQKEATSVDPCDYGISYWWNYTPTNSIATISRNADGYIVATKTAETGDHLGTFALEQIAVFNQIGPNTSINNTFSIDSPTARIDFYTYIQSAVDAPTGVKYRYSLPQGNWSQMQTVNVPFNKMIATTKADGSELIMLDGANFATWGTATAVSTYETFTLNGQVYSDYVCTATCPDNNSGLAAGFWLLQTTTQSIAPLTYKSISGTMYVVLKDALGVNYWYALPHADDWTTINLTWDMFTLVPYQSGTPSPTPTPQAAMTQIEFETNNSAATIQTYCWGAVPTVYHPNGEWSTQWFLHASDSSAFTWLVGDVVIQNQANQPFKYTPGVVPFSNQYSPSLRRNEFWRGTPYSGYQYPVNWLYATLPDYYENVIQFYWDCQQAYRNEIGVLGPFMPAYVWPRYDNLGEGPIESFAFGSDQPQPWAGYEPRGFFSACHLWAELVRQHKPVNPKLVQVCQNYAGYLLQFQKTHNGLTPSVFPRTAPPYNDGWDADPEQSNPDHVGHMTGLWLAGCVEMLNAGDKSGIPQKVIKYLLQELENTYVIRSDAESDMNGSFSPWAGGRMFYGFWAGEIFRGLGLYLEWLNKGNSINA